LSPSEPVQHQRPSSIILFLIFEVPPTFNPHFSLAMPRKESATGPISALAQQEQVSDGIENYELPKSLVTKIAKAAVSAATLPRVLIHYTKGDRPIRSQTMQNCRKKQFCRW
jgi:hypothetical protein